MAIICTQDDQLFNSYKEKVTFRKVIFHIKDIFKDHWNNFLNEYPNFNIRETIFYNIKRLLKCKTSALGFDVFKCKNFNGDFFIFGNEKGLTPLAYKQAQRRKEEIAQKADVKEIKLHDFRHSCASFLVNNGAPVTMVSKYLGHSNSSETLNTYSHLFNTTSSEVINTINRARNTVEN